MRRRIGMRRRLQAWTAGAGATAAMLLLMIGTVAVAGTMGQIAPAWSALRDALGVAQGPVYSVSYLRSELAVRPTLWLGRPVRVYAVATHVPVRYCPYDEDACTGTLAVFAAGGAAPALPAASLPLPLVWGLSDPLRARLRRVPLLTRFVPPQAPRWDRPATYRVVLRRLPGARCRGCYAAVLQDASPVAGL